MEKKSQKDNQIYQKSTAKGKLKIILDNQDKVKAWHRDGKSIEEIAKLLKIAKSTFYKLKNQESEVKEMFAKDENDYIFKTEESMFQLATGGYREVEEIVKTKVREFDPQLQRVVKEYETVQTISVKKYFPPEFKAAEFVLTNGLKAKYSKNPESEQDSSLDINITVKGDGEKCK